MGIPGRQLTIFSSPKVIINKKTATAGKFLNLKPGTRNVQPGTYSIQPDGHDHNCSKQIGADIPDAGATAGNKGLVELITEPVGEAKENNENASAHGIVPGTAFGNRIEGGCGKDTVDQAV